MVFSAIGRSSSRVHYAWIIVAVTFAVVVVSAGVRATPGVLIVPLEQEFHWSRATISLALGVNLLLFGAVGPFAAAVMDKFGARRTITASLLTTAISVALTPAMREPWQLILLWGVVVGLSTGFIGGYLAAYIAGRWFRAREGLVVGVLTAAAAAGQLVFLPTMAYLVTHLGWRAMSLILASVGLYGVLSYLTTQRTGEIGVRMALGARRGEVLRLMLVDGLRPALYGLGLGLAASVGAVRLIESMLYGTKPLDPAIFAAVAATLMIVAALACLLPAWRASRIDPMQALRTE